MASYCLFNISFKMEDRTGNDSATENVMLNVHGNTLCIKKNSFSRSYSGFCFVSHG